MHALHVLLILMFKILYILLNILERKSEMDKRHTENLAKELAEVRSAHLEDQQRMHDGKIHYIPQFTRVLNSLFQPFCIKS